MPRRTPPLTVAAIRGATLAHGEQRELPDGACPGLRLRLSYGGTAAWTLLVHDNHGRRRRIPVGDYPDMGLNEARQKAQALKTAARRGDMSPIPAKLTQGTLRNALEVYTRHNTYASWPAAKRLIIHVFDGTLDKDIHKVTTPDLQKVVDAHESVSSAAAAVRAIKPMLRWAARRQMVPQGLGEDLEGRAVKKRSRVLSDKELVLILSNLSDVGHDGAARVMLLTATRREEVAMMRWRDVVKGKHMSVWTIPAALRKNNAELRVPLPTQVAALLERVAASKQTQPAPDGLAFVTAKGKPLGNWDRWQKQIHEQTKTEGWHRHDLRRTAATIMGNLGAPPYIIEIVLGHKDPHTPLASVYNLSRYEEEHAYWLQTLADHIDEIMEAATKPKALYRVSQGKIKGKVTRKHPTRTAPSKDR